jgi:hypothetical protein
MRALIVAAAVLLVAAEAGAQQSGPHRALAEEVERVRTSGDVSHVPPDDSVAYGGRVVGPGEILTGTVAAAGGDLIVEGEIVGTALAIRGDVIVRGTGHVTGDAIAIGGRVRAEGGDVDGEMRSLSTARDAVGAAATPSRSTWSALKLTVGWGAVLLVLGLGILIFARPTLDSVVESIEQRFGRAFMYGLAAQVAAIPLLLVILVALALTIIGILLIPFAAVAYVITLCGLVALGFLAVARFAGGAIMGLEPARESARAGGIRAMVLGLVMLLSLWLAAAAFTWHPLASSILRAAALAVSWVAVTVGLGAVVASRVALRRGRMDPDALVAPDDPMKWQTPTPITGVAAARRQSPSVREHVS